MESVEIIKKYYEYLEKVANLSVTVHCLSQDTSKTFFRHALKIPDVHFNPYCTFVKQNLGLHSKCLACQKKSIQKCSDGSSFGGTCHAGVFEYVYPLKFADEIVGIVSVGGYKSTDFKRYAERICQENALDAEEIFEFSRTLKGQTPEKEAVDTLIVPLLCMIKNVSMLPKNKKVATTRSMFRIQDVLSYCNRFYTQKITMERLSERFFCSPSYIARNFKKETGKSLPEYISGLRIKNAMQLLQSTNSDVAQIGATVGYDDPSYFTKCFIKVAGVTPKQWRQMHQK